MLGYRWPAVCNAGPTLKQHCFSVDAELVQRLESRLYLGIGRNRPLRRPTSRTFYMIGPIAY